MAIPTSLIICGKTYKITNTPKIGGGSFSCTDQQILIGSKHTGETQHSVLIHEVLEIILTMKNLRFSKGYSDRDENGDYLYSFNHDQFEDTAEELAYVLRQIYGTQK